MSTSSEILSSAVETILSKHIDEDTCNYIQSVLSSDDDEDDNNISNNIHKINNNWSDADTREAVKELIEGSADIDTSDELEQLCSSFFQLLDDFNASISGNEINAKLKDDEAKGDPEEVDVPLRKLAQSVTMKDSDIQSFAMGLVAEIDAESNVHNANSAGTITKTTEAYSEHQIMSERSRRKDRQKKLRLEQEEKERQRAIQDAMSMIESANRNNQDDPESDPMKQLFSSSMEGDINIDVHFRNIDLHNARSEEAGAKKGGGGEGGGGSDVLLSNTNLTLSSGRRYGLMGRNGCGKTTFLNAIANRTFPNAIPKNMSILLVHQEIIGGELTALQTVLQSDIKREALKRYITWLEAELERLDSPSNNMDDMTKGNENDDTNNPDTNEILPINTKLKQRNKPNRRREAAKSKARNKKVQSSKSNSTPVDIAKQKQDIADKLSFAHQKLVQMEEERGNNPEGRARRLLAGLGFSPEQQDKPTKELSGGWRMRVSLTCALFAEPTLLLLDEPTNHLDLEAVLWLERWLTQKFKGTLVVVSHDRHFLNEIVTDVVHFYRNKLTTYRGDIDNYIAVVEENKKRQIRLREAQEAKREHLQKYIDLHAQSGENGVKAARQRKSRMKKLDRLGVMAQEGRRFKASYDGDAEEIEEFKEDEKVTLLFPDPGGFDGDVMKLEQVDFDYNPEVLRNDMLLKNVDLNIDARSRVALLGRNGCGKSTLIKLIVGELNPSKGKVTIDGRGKIEYLAQHQLEQLDPDGNPLKTMLERYPKDRGNTHIMELRRYLANFGLGGEILPTQKISTLSGGQKCRLCLASAMYRKPHILILDEPTNHLDLETTEALIEAIKSFQGGVLLVSHDQHLLTNVCNDLYVVERGKVERLRHGTTNGETFEAYKKAIIQGRR